MGKKTGLVSSLLIISFFVISPTNAAEIAPSPAPMPSAQSTPLFSSSQPKDKVQDIFRAAAPKPASDYSGVYFGSSAPSQVLSKIYAESRNPDGTHTQHLCSDAADQSCQSDKGFTEITVISGIGNCAVNPNTSCVESFSILDARGVEHKATPVTKFPASAAEFKGSPGNFPSGLTPWIWEVKNDGGGPSTEYFLNGSITAHDSTLMNKGQPKSSWQPKVNSFYFEVIPISRETSPLIAAPVVKEVKNDVTGTTEISSVGSLDGCVGTDAGVCLHRRTLPTGMGAKVTIHVPHSVSGWLVGRLDRPTVSVKKFSENQDAVTVSAGFLQNIVAGKYLKRSEIPTSAFSAPATCPQSQRFTALSNGIGLAMGMESGEDCALAYYKQWAKYLGDNAFLVQQGWTLASPTTITKDSCIKPGSGLQAVVASNASAYDPGAPSFDPKAQKLTYQVAAPTFAPDGTTENVGRYGVTMSEDYMKCLYGVKSIPTQVNLAITNSDGNTSIQSAALKSENGWVYFAADNFKYSDLSILTVTLPKSTAATAKQTAKPSAKPTPTKARKK